MKKTLLVLLAAFSMTTNVGASEKSVWRTFYLETPNKIQCVLCENGDITILTEVNKVEYNIEDGKLVEYRYSVQNGSMVSVKTIID